MILLPAACVYLIFATVTIKVISHLLKQWEQNHQDDRERWNDNDRENKTIFNINTSAGSIFALTFVNIFVVNIFLSIFTQRIMDLLANHFLDPLPVNALGSLIMIRGNNLAALNLTSIWLFQLLYILPLCRYFYVRKQWARVRKTVMVCILTLSTTVPLFALSMYNLFSYFKRT
jgi:hypothetical protein